MIIKHVPDGLFPHTKCDFNRVPLYPLQGESLLIRCRLEELNKSNGIELIYNEDKGDNKVAPIFNKDESSIEFKVAPMKDTRKIEYFFQDKSGQRLTKIFYVPILKEEVFQKPISAKKLNEMIEIYYEKNNKIYSLSVKFHQDKKIKINFAEVNESRSLIEKSEAFEYKKVVDEYVVLLNNDGIKIQSLNGDILYDLSSSIKVRYDFDGKVYNILQNIKVKADGIYGFGEKFDSINQLEKEPKSYVIEKFCEQGQFTYLPSPFFFTNCGVGLYKKSTVQHNYKISKEETYVTIDIFSDVLSNSKILDEEIYLGSVQKIISDYTEETGKIKMPPRWMFGPWMSSNGWNTQKEALEQVDKMLDLKIPSTVMVLEAWSDEKTFYIWNDAKYIPKKNGESVSYSDFSFEPDGKWTDPKAFVKSLDDNGLKLILWQIPVIKQDAECNGIQLEYDREYAVNNDLCVKNSDGTPYVIPDLWFADSYVPDFSNPETLKWWFDKRKYLVTELGVAGFKTDGGEFLFDQSCILHNFKSAREMHNTYPNMYVEAYHNFFNEIGVEGITFSRAGYAGAQKFPAHWAGDQMSTFKELKSQLKAGISAGLSGICFWGFDIGGFAGKVPNIELYLKAAAIALFSPIMQFHSEPRNGQFFMTERDEWNNDRTPWNLAKIWNDKSVIEIYRKFANLRMNLLPYIWKESEHCTETSRPLMAHLIYDYSNKECCDIEDEYMFGRDLLIAPLIEEGQDTKRIFLPDGIWYDLWNGRVYQGNSWIDYKCNLDSIPVFVKEGSVLPLVANEKLIIGDKTEAGAISNNIEEFENLLLLGYGNIDKDIFIEEMRIQKERVKAKSYWYGKMSDGAKFKKEDNQESAKIFGVLIPIEKGDSYGEV